MSNKKIEDLVNELLNNNKKIILIFAFNGTGKTRLSVEYKNITKRKNNDKHSGVYYNAYSEDLFYWDNDEDNIREGLKLNIIQSTLNDFHSELDENILREKLSLFKPSFNFKFYYHEDSSKSINYVKFYLKTESEENIIEYIKISRGEEQIFIWCFFLALFEIQGLNGEDNTHFFIDDPVSSLDDHNIFITSSTLMNLIDNHYKHRKIIITTHHFGFFSILSNWLKKGEKADAYKRNTQLYILKQSGESLVFKKCEKDVFLYHLELLQLLKKAIDGNEIYAYHFAILRQVLENIGSFLGVGRLSYVLEQIGVDDVDEFSRILNILSHKNVFLYETKEMVPDNEKLFLNIFEKIQNKYNFIIHSGENND